MRCLGLDLLRVAAVLLVLIRHAELPDGILSYLGPLQKGGWAGVDLFFVLSGFLVSSLLFKEYKSSGKVDIKRFLIRRGFKIYPPFWFLIFATLFTSAVFNQLVHSRSIIGEILFIQNYTSSLWNHTWSLAVEEHFYFLLAGLIFCLCKGADTKRLRYFPLFFIFVASLCLILRILNYLQNSDFSFKSHVYPTHLRVDSLLYGACLSYLVFFGSEKLRLNRIPRWILVATGLILFSPAFIWDIEHDKWVSIFGFTSIYFGAGFLVLAANRIESSTSRLLRTLGIFGSASYSIYLWHMPVLKAMTWLQPNSDGLGGHLRFIGYIFISFVGGLLLARLIENPTLKLRGKLFPVSN